MSWLAASLCAEFAALGALHFYWAAGGGAAKTGAIPEVGGKPAFKPSPAATTAVGALLCGCALLVAATARLLAVPVPQRWLAGLCYALALGLLVRAIGDFRLVGFFKRERGSRFARLDTLVYSPLCLVLAAGVALIAVGYG